MGGVRENGRPGNGMMNNAMVSRGEMRRTSFPDRVVSVLGQEIGAGLHQPGATLPVEAALAARFGVSRVVVREAIKGLVAKGMLSVRPRIGTRVREHAAWNLLDPQVLAWRVAGLHSPDGPAAGLIGQLMELRRIIEPPSVRLAARRATAEDVATMRAAFAAMREAVAGRGAYVPADLAFHAAILAACHNPFLQQLGSALSEILRTSVAISSRDPQDRALSLSLHEQVLIGIEHHDEEAAEAAILRLIGLAGAMLERVAGRAVGPAGR